MMNPPSVGAPPADLGQQPPLEEQKSFEYWENLLLPKANEVLVDRFIRDFQSNLVTSDVFYAIINLMYQKDDPAFKGLAVRAAGSVARIESYNFLIGVLSKEKNGSSTANAAQKELYQYDLPIALHVVYQVLTGLHDVVAVGYAVLALDSSTTKYLKPSPKNTYARLYTIFVGPLQKVIAGFAGDAGIIDPARRALARIQGSQIQNPAQPPVVAGQ